MHHCLLKGLELLLNGDEWDGATFGRPMLAHLREAGGGPTLGANWMKGSAPWAPQQLHYLWFTEVKEEKMVWAQPHGLYRPVRVLFPGLLSWQEAVMLLMQGCLQVAAASVLTTSFGHSIHSEGKPIKWCNYDISYFHIKKWKFCEHFKIKFFHLFLSQSSHFP